VRRPRWLQRLYAWWHAYFWEPCPLCGRHFGGHEWRDRPGKSSLIPHPDGQPGHGLGICPRCVADGKGSGVTWT